MTMLIISTPHFLKAEYIHNKYFLLKKTVCPYIFIIINNNSKMNFTPRFSVVFPARHLVVRDHWNLIVREKHSTKPNKIHGSLFNWSWIVNVLSHSVLSNHS